MGMCNNNKVFKYAYDMLIKKVCTGKISCINSSVEQASSKLYFSKKNMDTQPRAASSLYMR